MGVLRKKAVFQLVFAAAVATSSITANAANLRDVVNHTVQSNPDIKVTLKTRNAANAEVGQAFAGYLPKIDFNTGYGSEYSRNNNTMFRSRTLWRQEIGASLHQMLFDGFATQSEVERTRAKTNADSYNVWSTSEDVSMATVEAYLQVMLDRELVTVNRDNVAAHLRTYDMIKKRSLRGVGRVADINQAYGRLALARANLIAQKARLDDAETNYLRLTGMLPNHLTMPKAPSRSVLPKTEASAIVLAIKHHPRLKMAIADIEEARAQHSTALASFFPHLEVVFRGNDNYNTSGTRGRDDNYAAMLQLRYNILNGGADLARRQETAYQLEESIEIRNRTYRQVLETMRLAWFAMVHTTERLPQLRAHMTSTEKTVVAYRKQFQLGKRTLLDLLDSENERFQSKISYTSSRYLLALAKFRILNGMGRLLTYFNIPLPPEADVQYPDSMDRSFMAASMPAEQVVEYAPWNYHTGLRQASVPPHDGYHHRQGYSAPTDHPAHPPRVESHSVIHDKPMHMHKGGKAFNRSRPQRSVPVEPETHATQQPAAEAEKNSAPAIDQSNGSEGATKLKTSSESTRGAVKLSRKGTHAKKKTA